MTTINMKIARRFDRKSVIQDYFADARHLEFYTAAELWTNEHTSQKMLEYHLNESIDAASRNHNFINQSSKWIVNKFNLNTNSKVIDFGCGPGLYTLRLAQSGAEVTGIDFSKRSLNYAQKEADGNDLKIKYIHTNYLEYETNEKYDLIIMIMCDFAALSPSQRKILLSKFYTFLKPNGSILLDVYSHNYFNSHIVKLSATPLPKILQMVSTNLSIF